MAPHQQQQFTLPGYGEGVMWSVQPSNMGTITPTGLYTAPNVSGVAFIYAEPMGGGSSFISIVYLSSAPAAPTTPTGTSPTAGSVSSPVLFPSFGGGTPNAPAPSTPTPTVPSPTSPTSPTAGPTSPSFPSPIVPVGPTGPTLYSVSTPSAVSISIAPSSAYLQAGQSIIFVAPVLGTTNQQVQWTLSPNLGTIVNGFYTAPASYSSETQVTISATSYADPTKTATATVLLAQPITTPTLSVSSVSISVQPGTSTLTAGQSAQFQASVSGTTNTGVTWSLTPNIGTISNGFYTAPASITSQETVTLTATSLANSSKTATVSLVLKPVATPTVAQSVSLSLSPGSASLNGGQSTTFTPTVSGSSNTSVTWSFSPQVGTLNNGVYQAPATIASQQTVTVTAKSAADSTKTASATVTLIPVAVTVGPASVSLGAGKSATFTASVTGTSNTSVTWSLTPAVGTLVNGVYTAPATVSTAQTTTITATSVVDPTKTASATVTLTATPAAPATSSTITLPIEVMGPNGYTTTPNTFTIPTGTNLSGTLQLWMQIHGLKYDTEASVQVNNSAWMPISTGNVTLLGLAANYGGIGGGFHTLQMTMNLPAGAVTTGTNTISFRFNGTDGVTSGYRVLGFNVQSGGSNLISSSLFIWDDPNSWQAPSTAASDITAGQTLWHTAALTGPGVGPIQAHCSDCHSEDGRDLKYFNYSNNSIVVRSVFHGLTAAQGNQIASYIRSLNVPNPGRPWNPPYQPGPGLDSQPVANWAGGAGLSAVLDSDAEMQPYMLPGGSDAGWAATAYLNVRELPIPLQLPDWNSWLPQVHPTDAYGASFTTNSINTLYSKLHSILQPNNATAYKNSLSTFDSWGVSMATFMGPVETNIVWTPTTRTDVFSLAQWLMVKNWELNQEFGLEGMPQVVYGAKANPRGWLGNQAFDTSPIMLHIPAGTGLGNGTKAVYQYLAYIWYHMQVILNDGEGQESQHNPIDFGYVEGTIKDMSLGTGNSPAASLELLWLIKAQQEETLTGIGPQVSLSNGFTPTVVSPLPLVDLGWESDWSATSPATRLALTTDYVQQWFATISTFTKAQWYQGTDGGGRPWATATEIPANDNLLTQFGGQVWYMLPRLRFIGIDSTLVDQISAWAANIWPAGNWALNNAATCSSLGSCTSD